LWSLVVPSQENLVGKTVEEKIVKVKLRKKENNIGENIDSSFG
jgi:hypothetical protein